MKNPLSKSYFIVWIKFQRRALTMQQFFNYNLIFIPTKIEKRRFKLLDYFYKATKSISLLISKSPQVLWVQVPPSPLINLTLLYKFMNRKVLIIADCHNGLFGSKWGKYLKNGKYLNKFDLILVHNNVIRDIAIEMGVDVSKILILEDKPAYKTSNVLLDYQLPVKNKWILMPCSFAADEPLATVFEAAKKLPKVTIVISGDWKRNTGIHNLENLPDNILLTGYLSKNDYEALFLKADAVLGLTTEYHIQLSVANEATGFEKPMILSDTPLLRELFNRGAIYVDNFDSDSMADGILEALKNKETLTQNVMLLKEERNKRWHQQAQEVQKTISDLMQIEKARMTSS